MTRPIFGALEFDTLELCSRSASPQSSMSIEQNLPCPVPPSTAVVDAAIELFGAIFPFQDAENQAKILSQVGAHVGSSKLERLPAKKAAVLVNSVEAMRRALRVAMGPGARRARDAMGSARVAGPLKDLLQVRETALN